MLLLNSIVVGITVTTINGVLNYSRYADHYKEDGMGYFIPTLAVTFISSAGFVYILPSLLDQLNKRKQASIQKQLDEAEEKE